MSDTANNKIGCKGIKFLVKCDIPELHKLKISILFDDLGECEIGDWGMKYLVKGKWRKL